MLPLLVGGVVLVLLAAAFFVLRGKSNRYALLYDACLNSGVRVESIHRDSFFPEVTKPPTHARHLV